jgi:hypothetical protein
MFKDKDKFKNKIRERKATFYNPWNHLYSFNFESPLKLNDYKEGVPGFETAESYIERMTRMFAKELNNIIFNKKSTYSLKDFI